MGHAGRRDTRSGAARGGSSRSGASRRRTSRCRACPGTASYCTTSGLARSPGDCLRDGCFSTGWCLLLAAVELVEPISAGARSRSVGGAAPNAPLVGGGSADDRRLYQSLHRPQRTDVGTGSLLFRRFCARPPVRENPSYSRSGYLLARADKATSAMTFRWGQAPMNCIFILPRPGWLISSARNPAARGSACFASPPTGNSFWISST